MSFSFIIYCIGCSALKTLKITHIFGSLLELVPSGGVALSVRYEHLDDSGLPELGGEVKRGLVHSLVRCVEVEVEQHTTAFLHIHSVAVEVLHELSTAHCLQHKGTHCRVAHFRCDVQCVIPRPLL